MKILTLFCIIFYFGLSHEAKLGSYNIDKSKITVSGLSSGGSMAVQFHVAYSANISGVGVVSGPPYLCSGGNLMTALTACMNGLVGIISVKNIQNSMKSFVTSGLIDDISNLKDDQVYIFHGKSDFVVAENVVKKNNEFYQNYVSNSSQIKSLYNYQAAHGFVTNNFGTACSVTNSRHYINNCGYNQAYDILNHLYGQSVQEPAKGSTAKQPLIEFDQTEFFPALSAFKISMDNSGYIYVPEECKNGEVCKLHISLHGCKQGKSVVGNIYATKTGFNEVADLNRVIVIYPQAKASLMTNANGCWDWWGYSGANFATKKGLQMQVIKSIIDRVAGL